MPLGAFKAALMGTAGATTEGDVVLLSTTTASNAATVSITSGIDSTYGEYIFRFYNLNPATDNVNFEFQVNAAGASGYNETMTTTSFAAVHEEDDDGGTVSYSTDKDQAQGTAFQPLTDDQGNGGDESAAGELHLFNPSSTTYAKHFYTRVNEYYYDGGEGYQGTKEHYISGYINTTTAIDDIQFKMASGNFDGTIKLWGVK